MSTWADLAAMRQRGEKPQLSVFVTNHERFARNMWGVGSLVILHQQGEVIPVELLEGLDVVLMFPRCAVASRIRHLMDERGVKCASVRTWCTCGEGLTATPYANCDDYDEVFAE
jgi:hypothetical protein